MTSFPSSPPAVAVIGARTSHQGTGPWIANYLTRHGARIAGILGTSAASLQAARDNLASRFGINCPGFLDPRQMLAEVRPDLLVIASPSRTHGQYLRLALSSGVPVLCEKPLLWEEGRDNLQEARTLLEGFKIDDLPLFLNAQWPETIEDFKRCHPDCDLTRIASFEMEMSPASTGREMLLDAMPHVFSMTTALMGLGELLEQKISFANPTRCDITGIYNHANGRCRLHAALTFHPRQPRPFSYAINGRRVERVIDLADYSMGFKTATGVVPIADPLEKKIKAVLARLATPQTGTRCEPMHYELLALEMKMLAQTLKEQ